MSNKQDEIIKKQAALIEDLQEQLAQTRADLDMKNMFCDDSNATAKEFMDNIQRYMLELKEQIERARKAEKAYNDALAEIRPIIKKYKSEINRLSSSIKKTRLKI